MAHASLSHMANSSTSTPTSDCTRCGRDVTRIEMVRHGLELEFVSCSACETREWMRNGVVVDLDELLEELSASNREAKSAHSEAVPAVTPTEVQAAAPEPEQPAPMFTSRAMTRAPLDLADIGEIDDEIAMRFVA